MDALERARDHIGHDHVIVMMGDDIYDAADINSLCEDARNSRWSMLFHSGLDDSFTYTGGCVINERIFDIPAVPIKDGSETGLPQTLAAASIKFDIPVQMRLTRTWRKMNKPEDLAN